VAKKGFGVTAPVARCPLPPRFESYAKTFDHGVSNFERYVSTHVPALQKALFDFAATGKTVAFKAWAQGVDAAAKAIKDGQ
jgi:hypothetical protein